MGDSHNAEIVSDKNERVSAFDIEFDSFTCFSEEDILKLKENIDKCKPKNRRGR